MPATALPCRPTPSTSSHNRWTDERGPLTTPAATTVASDTDDEILAIAECRLDVAGLRTQADRYRRLGATATAIDRRSGVLNVTFGPALDETLLNETIAADRDCCAFFGFEYQPDDQRLSITVKHAEQEPALNALHFAITAQHITSTTSPR